MSQQSVPPVGATIPAVELKAFVPEAVGRWRRGIFDVQLPSGGPFTSSLVKASFGDGKHQMHLTISDWGGIARLAWPAISVERDVDGGSEKIYKLGDRTLRELSLRQGRHREFTVILSNGVAVEAAGDGVDLASLKLLIGAVDLTRIEAIQRPAR